VIDEPHVPKAGPRRHIDCVPTNESVTLMASRGYAHKAAVRFFRRRGRTRILDPRHHFVRVFRCESKHPVAKSHSAVGIGHPRNFGSNSPEVAGDVELGTGRIVCFRARLHFRGIIVFRWLSLEHTHRLVLGVPFAADDGFAFVLQRPVFLHSRRHPRFAIGRGGEALATRRHGRNSSTIRGLSSAACAIMLCNATVIRVI
jgi:hypothetical protein